MKPVLLLVLALVLGAFAAGGLLLLRTNSASGARSEPASASPAAAAVAPAPASEVAQLRAQLSELEDTVAQLSALVATLQGSARREAVETPEQASARQELVAAGLTPVQIESRMREVFADEREREEREREEARREREVQAAQDRAARIARELSMSAADQTVLAQHLVSSQDKRRDLMEGMREGGFDREAMRTSFEQFREWNDAELARLFGADLAAQIQEQSGDFFGGRGGGRPGGFGGRGGRGGGGGGGGD